MRMGLGVKQIAYLYIFVNFGGGMHHLKILTNGEKKQFTFLVGCSIAFRVHESFSCRLGISQPL
jgi:hypothetical protein